MSNLPPNPYNHTFGSPPMNANVGQPMHPGQQYSQPLNQPNYTGLKQDPNSNSLSNLPPPITHSSGPVSSAQQVNNFSQSANSSPAFNRPGMMPSLMPGLHSSQLRPPLKPMPTSMPGISQFPSTSAAQNTSPQMSGQSPFPPTNASPYPPNYTQQQARQINDIAPPLTPASQPYNPAMNGPPVPYPPGTAFSQPSGQYPPTSTITGPATSSYGQPGAMNLPPGQPVMSSPLMLTRPGPPQTNTQITAPSRNSPLPGPPTSGGATIGPPRPMNGPVSHTVGPHLGPPISQAPLGPPKGPVSSGPNLMGIPSRPSVGPASGPSNGPSINGTALGPRSYGPPSLSGIPGQPPMGPPNMGGPQSLPPTGLHSGSATGPQSLPPAPPMGQPMNAIPPSSGKMPGPPMNNMYNRYPQMPQSNFNNQSQQMPPAGASRPYPQQQYNAQGMTQQMSQLSVTKQGFDQLWGHHMVDLMQCKHILPEYPEDPPEIKLGHQFAESDNCSPEILRCTVNRIPETNNLLQKSRLPLGILIHPFKDLNHLPVIQCATIVRCRACRTYINPFVYFVDSKRWKCNLCYRVNDLPEEFQYDPVSKSYGDPSRRPEIRSATIEFIAPGEYMLRPPQPAVYLFLLDVSQRARESGYLQVFCDTLKSCLDKLPGDARTQVGFICYDAHIHYYLMSEELNRPKEMTVLDVDDIFLPSPESLLVNLGERRELIIELLSVLPRRYSAQGAPSSALGAALQAAYKLMAPTGGRVSVFQTCLPNVGPGALQAREDPNARSSKDVAHLNPATDFYKRLALDCSGAQVAVDLFLLNSQYSDLATLSGMSKFSAGSVHHIPLFNATRSWQADHFQRMLNRYLTRKIGFEAVMRVRCTRGIAIHTFHGNFFVRSTDLLSLPNVSPDAAFGMQLAIEESLADLQQVCFQAALLYTSSKGERRIRVHTLALPIANNLTDVLHSADQECIVGLLSKMAVDRCASASMSEAREALINVAVDALSAHRLAQNLPAGAASPGLHAPMSLALLPLHLLALLKTKAFRTGTSTRLDDRVADMCALKTQPLSVLLRAVYPALYPIHALEQQGPHGPNPPRLQLTAERINATGAYLLDDGETMIIYVCHAVSPAYLSDTFGATSFSQLPDEARALPALELDGNENLHAFIDRLNDDRPFPANVLLIKDTSPSRTLFTERLIEDRVESAFSYYEFLQHVKNQVK